MNEQHPAGGLTVAPPVAIEQRPLGVTLLACVAFCVLAVLVVAATLWATALFRDRRENPQDLPAYIGVTITSLCILTLAVISCVAGVDLLKLRKRGHSLAIVSMFLWSILGMFFAVIEILDRMEDKEFFWAGFMICALSISALLYLYRPKVRRRFAAPSTAGSD